MHVLVLNAYEMNQYCRTLAGCIPAQVIVSSLPCPTWCQPFSSTAAVQASQLPFYVRSMHLWLAMDQVRTVDNIQNKRYEMALYHHATRLVVS